jgi:hypothetical protein
MRRWFARVDGEQPRSRRSPLSRAMSSAPIRRTPLAPERLLDVADGRAIRADGRRLTLDGGEPPVRPIAESDRWPCPMRRRERLPSLCDGARSSPIGSRPTGSLCEASPSRTRVEMEHVLDLGRLDSLSEHLDLVVCASESRYGRWLVSAAKGSRIRSRSPSWTTRRKAYRTTELRRIARAIASSRPLP